MNTQQHSAGPWEYRGYPTPLGIVFDISQAEPGVEDVAYTYSNSGNARLIAAAPCLLAVAKKIKAHGTVSASWIDELDAAINKATRGTT